MRRLRLRKAAVRRLLDRMDEVGKLDRVLNEEHRNVIADQVPISLLGVELGRKAAHIAGDVGRSLVARHSGKAREGRGLLADALKNVGAGQLGMASVNSKWPCTP